MDCNWIWFQRIHYVSVKEFAPKAKVTEEYISKDELEGKFMETIEGETKKWESIFLYALEES